MIHAMILESSSLRPKVFGTSMDSEESTVTNLSVAEKKKTIFLADLESSKQQEVVTSG